MQHDTRSPLTRQALALILLARTVSNLNYRIVYPFLPAFARGLGISLERAGQFVSVQGGVGLLAPLFGFLSDKYGRKRTMEGALLLMALAAGVAFLTGRYLPVLLAFAGFGIAKALYEPALQAYVGDLVPYAQRGRVIAITELGWSFAWLLGVPAAGFLIERVGWRAPWAVIALLALASIAATHRYLPDAPRHSRLEGDVRPLSAWRLLRRPPVRAALATAFGTIFAIEHVFIVYGAFLEDRFGLTIGAIGLASVVVGVAELAAEGGAAAWTDSLGKKRSVLLGLLLFAAALLLLAGLGGQLWTALASYALAILFFEFTIVSFLPLMTELAPDARATLLSLNIAAMGSARIVAPLLGAALFARTGSILVNAALSAVVCLLSALVMWRGVQE